MKQNILFLIFLVSFACGLSAQRIDEGCVGCNNAGNGAIVDNKKNNSDITIYPNPATDFFSISNEEAAEHITIFSVLGRKLATFVVSKGEKYNISDLSSGTYLVQVADKQGKTLVTQRFYKK